MDDHGDTIREVVDLRKIVLEMRCFPMGRNAGVVLVQFVEYEASCFGPVLPDVPAQISGFGPAMGRHAEKQFFQLRRPAGLGGEDRYDLNRG